MTRQYNPDEVPSVSASAELRDLAGGYVGPNRTYPVKVAATQPDGAGLRRLWLTLVPENELAGEDVPCTTTPFDLVCPQTFDVPLDIDFAPLPEGPTTLRGAALDDEQNRGNSAAWEVTVDKTAPVQVAASGELFDARDGYINGQGNKSVTVSAVDPEMANGTRLSGIKRLQLEDVGHGIVAATDVSCTALACPVTASETLNVDAGPLVEGAHQLRVVATDLVGNVSRSAPWTVNVDKTPPDVPPNMDATFNPEDGITDLTWDPPVDPELSDGTPGSTLASQHQQVRYQVAGQAWTTWQTPVDSELPGETTGALSDGQSVTLEVKVRDAVGNERIASATLAATPSQLTGQNVGLERPSELNDPLPAGSNEPGSTSPVDVTPAGTGPAGSRLAPNQGTGSEPPAPSLLAASTFDHTLCDNGSPCGRYRPRDAIAYANKTYNTRNRDYPDYDSDCTNFASQILHFGGLFFERTAGGINDPRANTHDDGPREYFTGTGSWWAYVYYTSIPPIASVARESSQSWRLTPKLYHQLIDNGLAINVHSFDQIRPGDVLFYKLNGAGTDIDHAQFVVQVTHKRIVVVQHTRDYRSSLKRVYADLLDRHPNFELYAVRPKFTAFNIPN